MRWEDRTANAEGSRVSGGVAEVGGLVCERSLASGSGERDPNRKAGEADVHRVTLDASDGDANDGDETDERRRGDEREHRMGDGDEHADSEYQHDGLRRERRCGGVVGGRVVRNATRVSGVSS